MKDRYITYGANAMWQKHETTGTKMQRHLKKRPVSHLNPPVRGFDVKYKAMAVLACFILWLGIIALAVKSI
jgi:hypothetical protein